MLIYFGQFIDLDESGGFVAPIPTYSQPTLRGCWVT
jgi:hypothetical protein